MTPAQRLGPTWHHTYVRRILQSPSISIDFPLICLRNRRWCAVHSFLKSITRAPRRPRFASITARRRHETHGDRPEVACRGRASDEGRGRRATTLQSLDHLTTSCWLPGTGNSRRGTYRSLSVKHVFGCVPRRRARICLKWQFLDRERLWGKRTTWRIGRLVAVRRWSDLRRWWYFSSMQMRKSWNACALMLTMVAWPFAKWTLYRIAIALLHYVQRLWRTHI